MQQQIIRETFHLVSKRDDNVCNFLEGGRWELLFNQLPVGQKIALWKGNNQARIPTFCASKKPVGCLWWWIPQLQASCCDSFFYVGIVNIRTPGPSGCPSVWLDNLWQWRWAADDCGCSSMNLSIRWKQNSQKRTGTLVHLFSFL